MKERKLRKSKEKKLRRELEILKAQIKTYAPNETLRISPPSADAGVARPFKAAPNALPTRKIKRDLTKTFLFAASVSVVFVTLKTLNVTHDDAVWLGTTLISKMKSLLL
ncbi:hypothetical protein HYW61_01275 [candidate division WWE3 bacterium]|nr:hypothetical protein [candidate division WWE3 bacterium]